MSAPTATEAERGAAYAAKYARVAVERTAYHFDRLFDYLIPDELSGRLTAGCRVLVPFGQGTHGRQGIVLALADSLPPDCPPAAVKPVSSMLDDEPVLSAELVMLAQWLSETCFCTLFEAAKAMLPAGLSLKLTRGYRAVHGMSLERLDGTDELTRAERAAAAFIISSGGTVTHERLLCTLGLAEGTGIPQSLIKHGIIESADSTERRTGDKALRLVRIADGVDIASLGRLSPKQREVLELLEQVGSAVPHEITEISAASQAVISGLVKKGILEYHYAEVYRRPRELPDSGTAKPAPIVLTDEQQTAFEHILERCRAGETSISLLFGVTGSGKTSVFLRLIDEVLADGRGVIVMVPEIALTPQTIRLFRDRFGDRTALFHSGLSMGERIDEWKRVKRGEAKIAVGTRSAVFAPFDDIGLIIIDEEQEYTYKSESSPRYHARDVARFRCAYHKAALVLASATPALESFYYAQTGRYQLERLTKRYGDAVLPYVRTIDISEQRLADNVISEPLRQALKYNLDNGYQSILLHNRRGYNTFASCRACGKVLTCKNCSVSMTYHHDTGRLVCHYCGASVPMTTACPECGAEQLRYAGQGTQRVELELSRLFPEARILRMDADTTATRCSHAERLSAFARGDYDIMIGTQMVAKGLDFERVTLAGVLLADQMLYSDDFRSFEKAFSLLTQVVGRSGRGGYRGQAIIQTLTPENNVIAMATRQDYEEFYGFEIQLRRVMLYPPFSDICVIGFNGDNEETVRDMSREFVRVLAERAAREHPKLPLRVLGPTPAAINKIKGKFRYRIILKCRSSAELRAFIKELLTDIGSRKEFSDATVFADMNPECAM